MRSKEEHRKYINSDLWKTKREEALAHHGHRCASCGTTENIQVHHISYLRLSHYGPGKETMEDLIPLCGRHHQLVHKLINELKERNKNIPGYNWEKASKEAIEFIKSSESADLRRRQKPKKKKISKEEAKKILKEAHKHDHDHDHDHNHEDGKKETKKQSSVKEKKPATKKAKSKPVAKKVKKVSKK